MDKSRFLDEQSEDAKAAMRATIEDAKNEVLGLLDLRGWVKSHPWKTVAAAAATGFVAGDMIRRPTPASDNAPESATPQPTQPTRRSGMGQLLFGILKQATTLAFTFARPIVEELLAAHAAAGNGAAHRNDGGQNPPQPSSSEPSNPQNRP